MEDENDGCKCQEEPRSEPQHIPDYMLQGSGIASNGTIASNHGSLNVSTNWGTELSTEPASPLKIDKILIEQMDYGYLVKAGCQTLCVETKKNLITLFTEYINDPRRVRSLYDANDLSRLYEEAEADLEENLKRRISEIEKQVEVQKQKNVIDIGVIGKNLDDVRDYLRDIVPIAVKTKNGVRKYMVETQEFIMYYYAISTVDHIRGMGFNKVVETHRARDNKDFHRIMEGLDSKKGLSH